MADIFDLPDNLSRKGLEKMAGIKYDPDVFFHHKRQTNADRIRAMSDEELAECLRDIVVDSVRMIMFTHESRGIQEWLDWLKAEVET